MEEGPANVGGPWLVSADSHGRLVRKRTLALLSSAKVLFPNGGFSVQAAACPWIIQANMLWPPGFLQNQWASEGLKAGGAEAIIQF